MQLSKIATFLFATTLAFSSVDSLAAAKKSSKSPTVKVKTVAVKTVKSVKKKTVSAKNHTKVHYGVKGAKLQPTKVSSSTYSYREKGKMHQTIGKEASRQYGQTGVASYYGGMFNGRKTANGEIFNENSYTAAHKTLALGSYALVTNLRNGRKVIVKINDRGPFSHARIIDLSKGAAREIGMIHSGVARVRVEAMHVDSQGYISGKGAEALYKLAKREGLPLKVKQLGSEIAFKADETPAPVENKQAVVKSNIKQDKTPTQAVKKAEKIAKQMPKQPMIQGSKLTVVTKTEKEAKRIALQVKQKAIVQKSGDNFSVVIAVSDKNESSKVQKQVGKLAHYKSINYSRK